MEATTTARTQDLPGPATIAGIDDEIVPVFAYQPLPAGSNIRILELQPSRDPSAPLEAKLVGANISSGFNEYSEFDYEANFNYEAVSYCWGEPLFTEPLILRGGATSQQGAVKYVTTNLRDALLRLRFRDHGRENDAEKTTQIGYMTEIYNHASGVLIWLGHSEDGANCFRLWVVQELVWSTNITMFCGKATMPWLRLYRVLIDERLAWFHHDKLTIYRMAVRWKMQYLGRGNHDNRFDLTALLEDYDDLECADDKDHLFAIAGLAYDTHYCTDIRHGQSGETARHEDTYMLRIKVDYRKPTTATYMDAVARLVIANSNNVSRILAMVGKRSAGGDTPGPTWALDWREPRLNGAGEEMRDELDKADGLDDNERFAACTVLGDIQDMVQRIMRGRSVCIIDHLTHGAARVDGMGWPGLGVVPSHAQPGDVVMALNAVWKARHWVQNSALAMNTERSSRALVPAVDALVDAHPRGPDPVDLARDAVGRAALHDALRVLGQVALAQPADLVAPGGAALAALAQVADLAPALVDALVRLRGQVAQQGVAQLVLRLVLVRVARRRRPHDGVLRSSPLHTVRQDHAVVPFVGFTVVLLFPWVGTPADSLADLIVFGVPEQGTLVVKPVFGVADELAPAQHTAGAF
ncbi:uncharacterized protein PG986_012729 [Apiospora aurea]|uniref:Heterokaryon incompatibility domain-containing protein n=1 Tax=Apiospora aurea TaxID=335848 RepID=A0ABR1Q0T9_9PEZI